MKGLLVVLTILLSAWSTGWAELGSQLSQAEALFEAILSRLTVGEQDLVIDTVKLAWGEAPESDAAAADAISKIIQKHPPFTEASTQPSGPADVSAALVTGMVGSGPCTNEALQKLATDLLLEMPLHDAVNLARIYTQAADLRDDLWAYFIPAVLARHPDPASQYYALLALTHHIDKIRMEPPFIYPTQIDRTLIHARCWTLAIQRLLEQGANVDATLLEAILDQVTALIDHTEKALQIQCISAFATFSAAAADDVTHYTAQLAAKEFAHISQQFFELQLNILPHLQSSPAAVVYYCQILIVHEAHIAITLLSNHAPRLWQEKRYIKKFRRKTELAWQKIKHYLPVLSNGTLHQPVALFYSTACAFAKPEMERLTDTRNADLAWRKRHA